MRRMEELARKAIKAALSSDWDEAIQINLHILSEQPADTDALNRVAQAYIRTGKLAKAKSSAHKVISIDPLNSIALKCVDRCNALDGKDFNSNIQSGHHEQIFIEEPGKTKIVSLINICEPSLVATLLPGDPVNMVLGTRKVIVTTYEDSYIGRFPDDLSSRLIYLNKVGNSYRTHVKSATIDDVKIFLRETLRSDGFQNEVSFPNKR